ncbi:hypothetical protein EDB86DRAFT_3086427 [Lactarius hatsudake]|nr:hypothetical protein EDB86DRAFT_3086427 [Lactarius hatsudake]
MQSESDHPSKHSSGESEVFVPSTRALGDRFSVTPQDASILKRYVEEFQKADTETRKTILEKAMGELYATRPPNATFDKKEAKRKIRTWFYNHYSRPHRQLIKFTRKWSARNAFYHENKEEVMELAKKMSGGIPGSQAFLGALQDAMTSLWRKLSSEGQEPYVEIAKEWSEDKPPRDVQAKMAQAAFRGRIVRDFQTQLFKTCGMRSIVLVAYADKDGKPRAAMDDWNKVLDDGMSFSDFCPNWRNAMIWQEWMKYCRTSFAPGFNIQIQLPIPPYIYYIDHDQSIPIGRSKTLKTKVKLITDADGEPEIPSVTLEDGYSTKVVQTALRDYCHAHIRKLSLLSKHILGTVPYNTYELGFISGRKNATIPWSKLSRDPAAWIEEECFPVGFPWVDPSKLRLARVFQLLDHWRQRQKEGLIPLIWNPSCELLSNIDQPAHRVRNPQWTNRRRSNYDEPESDYSSEEEDFANEICGLHSPTVTPPLPPSPSPSPLCRNEETEQTFTPNTGESSRLPLSNISRPDTVQTRPQRPRGTPIVPTPYNDSDVPELKQGRLKRVVKVTHKARYTITVKQYTVI